MKKVLIVVDVQRDFIDGSLAVPNAEKIIPNVNSLMTSGIFDMVVATQDWHPPFHKEAFKDWPVHCEWGTKGAEFSPYLLQFLSFPR
jgi:nicotinamidase/pyrazinamidase